MSKFTPGPWRTGTDDMDHSAILPPKPDMNGFYVIAETHGPEAEANARLIAAAPDMLAALKELVRFVDSVGSEHINRVPFAAARAAIAKAEGKS